MGCDGALLASRATTLSPPLTFAVGDSGRSHTIRRTLDPEDPALRDCGRARLAPVFARLATRGHLFALYQDAGHLDPHGHDGLAYPSDVPFGREAWGPYGLLMPASNPGFSSALADLAVRAADGRPMPGWDSAQNLGGTSWSGSGFPLYPISPTSRADYYLDGLAAELAPGGLGPRAAYVDAADADVPSWNLIDRVTGSPRAHTIAAALAAQQEALEVLRRRVGGPLFGEGSYAGRAQWESFESGLWDGRARQMTPPDELAGRIEPTLGQPVIPDFELFSVLPRASAHHGMGWESLFGDVGSEYGFPVDLCPAWNPSCDPSAVFLDPWFAHEVSFGHMAYAGLNGWVPNEYRTLEGVLREYALIGGVHGAIVASEAVAVGYVDAAGVERTLDEALAVRGYDFVHPRLRVRYAGGLEVFVNHAVSTEPWSVALPPDPSRGFDTVRLPRHGFAVFDRAGLLVFSAFNPDPSAPSAATRVEYARVPGRYTMVCGRGTAQTVAGFPDAETRAALSDHAALLAHTVLRSETRRTVVAVDRALGTRGSDPNTSPVSDALELSPGSGAWVVRSLGAPPPLVAIDVRADADVLPAEAQTGLRAIGRYEGGAWVDLTTRVAWQSSDDTVLRVDTAGAASALRRGEVEVSARLTPEGGAPPISSAPISLRVTPAP
jgi:hypothetical protein